MRVPMIFAAALTLAACETTRIAGSETEAEICRQWGNALPTRSRADTEQTKAEITALYGRFELTCPEFANLIP